MKHANFEILSAPTKFFHRALAEEFPPEPIRSEFERDRDRILYSKAFRRLSGKTQVFIPKQGDHLRTRLTHTVEVSQIARTIARNLGLNEILVEAIALGHDLGHTPFGHVGEEMLNQILNNCDKMGDFQDDMAAKDKGFKHNYQGLRVLADKENIYDYQGLNISSYTLWGILNHTRLFYKSCPYFGSGKTKNCFLLRNPKDCSSQGNLDLGFYKKYLHLIECEMHESWSFEGLIVGLADEIAQRQHDTEDALLMDVVSQEAMVELINRLFKRFCQGTGSYDQMLQAILRKAQETKEQKEFLTYLSKFLVELYVSQVVRCSSENLTNFKEKYGINDKGDFEKIYPTLKACEVNSIIQFEKDFSKADDEFHEFLKNRIINSHTVQQMDGRGRYILRSLVKAYITNPRQLYDTTVLWVFKEFDPEEYRGISIMDKEKIGEMRNHIDAPTMKQDGPRFQIILLRAICDYISGMTDEFAIQQYHNLYGY